MRRLSAASKRLARLLLLGALLGGLPGYGGPAQATFPGRNGRIAYSVGPIFPQDPPAPSQVLSVNPDGSGRRQLTHVAADQAAGSPAWSPDGTRIAYVSNVRGDLELGVMAADGSGQHPLTSDPRFAHFEPSWSPDGRQIVFASNLGGDIRLYTINRDGSDRRLVFDDHSGYADVFPGYTLDGRRLVFQRCLPDDGVCAIHSVGLDGGGLRALTQFRPGANEVNDFWPTVAPDGRIAFGRPGAGGITSQVYVMGAAGAGAHPITPPALLAVPGEWTPDSRQLVINSNGFRLNSAIYRVWPDGSGLRRLTRPCYPHNDILASPAPAGDRVVFVSDRRYPDVCCNDLYVMRSDGSGLHRVPTGDLNGVGNPDWGSAPRDSGAGAAAAATGSGAALAGRVGDRRRPPVRPRPAAPADRSLRHAGPVSTSAPAGNAHGPPASRGWGTEPRPRPDRHPVPVR